MTAVYAILAGCLLAAVGWWWSNRGIDGANRVALVALLGVLATTYNVVVPIANVEATTTMVICAALVLGARTGAAVGIVAVIGTSSTSAFGTWTLWQVVGTCVMAVVAAAAAHVFVRVRVVDWTTTSGRVLLGALVAVATLAYDVVVTVPTVFAVGAVGTDTGLERMASALLLGVSFTLVHVVATTALSVMVGPSLLQALERARLRLAGGVVTAR